MTQTLAREKTNKNESQSKDDQQILPHISDYQLSKDKKYLEIIPGGRKQGYPTSSSHQPQTNLPLVDLTCHLATR